MKLVELHKAVLNAICQKLSDGASVYLTKYTEDEHHIEAVLNFEHYSSYERLQDLSGILCRYDFIIGKIYFGAPAEIHIISWIPDCRFKTAIAEVCSIFGLYEEDDQTIREVDIEIVGKIIACAMEHKVF